ncbi:MAG: type II toxin-antitoxin system death-on-curing family toxin [Bacteroidota bacterium]
MITLEKVLTIHSLALDKFGGSEGVRDMNLLDSAIKRPFATFDGQELYPKATDKAAAIIESIVKNHPFSDGNKRTGYILMRFILLKAGIDVEATEDEKYDFVIRIAESKMAFEEIKLWIEDRLEKNKKTSYQ